MKISIGCDHAGYELKDKIKKYLSSQHSITDKGTNGPESVDYPDFAHAVAQSVTNQEVDFGILICGSANGVAMSANKHQGIRAAICWQPEIAKLAHNHNNANIICLPARFVSDQDAEDIVRAYIETTFEGGRHQRRVEKIDCA